MAPRQEACTQLRGAPPRIRLRRSTAGGPARCTPLTLEMVAAMGNMSAAAELLAMIWLSRVVATSAARDDETKQVR